MVFIIAHRYYCNDILLYINVNWYYPSDILIKCSCNVQFRTGTFLLIKLKVVISNCGGI